MQKRPIPLYINKVDPIEINIIKFVPEDYLRILTYEIIPKIINIFSNKEKQQNWQNLFNSILPKTHLNYSNEDTYLQANNLSRPDVIQNSIKQIFSNLNETDIFDLTIQLLPLTLGHKIKVIQDSGVAVYNEVIILMQYVKSNQDLVQRYKKPYSDNKGTGHRSSSLKNIVKTQINMLENRLNGSHFRIQSEDEITQTESMLNLLNNSQKTEYKNGIEFLNYGRLLFGLDIKLFDLTHNEKVAFEQVLDFHNGIRSKPHELIRSCMIYMDILFDKSKLDSREKAEHVLNITRFFFQDELKKAEKSKKNVLAFNHKHIDKPYRIKTVLHQVPIYAYSNNSSADFIEELMEIGVNGILGVKNMFESDKPTIEEMSWIAMARNVIHIRNEFNFTKKELKVLLYFSSGI